MKLRERIIAALNDFAPKRFRDPVSAQAAVLLAIDAASNPAFLLTRRTETVATHKGQISFPGGIRESEDRSLTETALRETEEEIGLPKSRVEVLGEFHDYLAVTNFLVRPVIGLVPVDLELIPQPEEVEYILRVPVGFFRDTEPVIRHRMIRGKREEVLYFDYNGETVWGLTARIIRDFLLFVGG